MARSRESEFACVSFRRMTGRQYPNLEAAFEELSPEALRELVRLVVDLDDSVRQAASRAAREPWRHGL